MIYKDQVHSGQEGTSDDRVVVEPRVQAGLTDAQGGMLLEGRGKVVTVGSKVNMFKPGDEVVFDPSLGQDVLLYGRILKILAENEVQHREGDTPTDSPDGTN